MPSVDYLKECRDFYARVLQPCFGAPLGASETAVSELQQKLGFTLPESYRQFLLWMGEDKQGPLRGSEWFVDDILPNGEFLDEFLLDNGVAETNPVERICFFVHQGYMAAWFAGGDAEDPLCHLYSESYPEPVVSSAGAFSSFLLKELRGAAEAIT